MRNIKLLFLILLTVSCSSDDDGSSTPPYGGGGGSQTNLPSNLVVILDIQGPNLRKSLMVMGLEFSILQLLQITLLVMALK
jgi:hypothetical protein